MAWGRTPMVPEAPGGHRGHVAVLAGDAAPARELGMGGGPDAGGGALLHGLDVAAHGLGSTPGKEENGTPMHTDQS